MNEISFIYIYIWVITKKNLGIYIWVIAKKYLGP